MDSPPDHPFHSELLKLGQRLRSLRRDQGWTLADLSQQVDSSEAYLSRLESGDRQPSLAILFKLAQVCFSCGRWPLGRFATYLHNQV